MTRPLALDLFCCAGGASMGLYRAGFDVIGVDIKPRRKSYPFPFVQADALRPPFDLSVFDLIWASPPCQAYTSANGKDFRGKHADLIPPTRDLLAASAMTVIENVPGAPLRADLVLDGTMFPDLRTVRRRHFELSFPCPMRLGFPTAELVARHRWVSATDGDTSSHTRAARRKRGQPVHDPVPYVAACLGVDWMQSRWEIAQAIPPAYAEFIGRAALAHVTFRAAAE